jgi:hypothetical protein
MLVIYSSEVSDYYGPLQSTRFFYFFPQGELVLMLYMGRRERSSIPVRAIIIFGCLAGEALSSVPLHFCAGILEQSMGPRNRVRIGLSYRPAKLHRLADSWAP